MKIKTIIIILNFCYLGFCQINENSKNLRVLKINEFKELYTIECLFQERDTLLILSPKEKVKKKCLYDKIKVGNTYRFILKETPVYMENITIRCKGIIFWKTGDDPEKMPYFANNINGIYIKKD